MDEGVVSAVELEEFARLGMMDGVAMKPARCGGLSSCRRQIEACLSRGLLWLGSGLTDPDISLAASLILYGAYGLAKPAALNGPQFLAGDVLKKPLRIADGDRRSPCRPGPGDRGGRGQGRRSDEAKRRGEAEMKKRESFRLRLDRRSGFPGLVGLPLSAAPRLPGSPPSPFRTMRPGRRSPSSTARSPS